MKNYIFKGEPGYLLRRKKKLLMGCLAGFMLILGFFIAGYLIYGTAKNILSIPAVLIVLPTAKIFVQYMLIPWKCNADRDEYKRLSEICKPLKLYCELVVTGSEKSFELLYVYIDKDENIIVYSKQEKAKEELFEKAVVNFLNYYNFDAKVSMYKDFDKFEERLRELAASNASVTEEEKEHAALVFEKFSIMSI